MTEAPESHGRVRHADGAWFIQCPPHVMLRLKRVFGRVDVGALGVARLSDTPETCRELAWFLQRFPMEVDRPDHLAAQAAAHAAREATVRRVLAAGYAPRAFDLAVPPRDYQRVAAELLLANGALLVADDVGLGKTVSAIAALSDPRTRPALVVTLTHLPAQWVRELARFAPGLNVHVLKSGKPYDLTKGPRGKPVPFPDVIVTNYHKLHGWAETLAGVVRSVTFDECVRWDTEVALWPPERGQTARVCDLAPGATVVAFTPQGDIAPDNVLAVVPKGRRAVWRLTLADGRTLDCTSNERLWTDRGWIYLQELLDEAGLEDPRESPDAADGAAAAARAGDAAGGRLDGVARLDARAVPREPRRGAGGVLPAQGGGARGLRAERADDRAEPGVGARDVRVQHGHVPRVRVHTLGVLPPRRDGEAREDGHPGVARGAGLGGGRVLVPGRRDAPGHRSDGLLHALLPGGSGPAARGVADGARGRGAAGGDAEGRAALLDDPAAAGVESRAGRADPAVRPELHGVQDRAAAGARPDHVRVLPRGDLREPSSDGGAAELRRGGVPGRAEAEVLRGAADAAGEACLGAADLVGLSFVGFDAVWDVETERHHTFFANGVAVHNCQELRSGSDSWKGRAARHIAARAAFRCGLSATPVYNYGGEIFHVLDTLAPGALGTRDEFGREWCTHGGHERVREPRVLAAHLRAQGLMLRRTRAEVGRELPPLQKVPLEIGADLRAIDAVSDRVAELARVILAQGGTERGEKLRAAEEISWRLRQATGVAKAPFVADFVRLLIEQGEPRVLLYGHHHVVYDLWRERLADLNPVFYTGEESPKQKDEARRAFVEGTAKVLVMALRAGAGLDGLQTVCRTVVHGELDWSPGVHEQCDGRLFRDGQPDPVVAYYPVSDAGSDPVVADVLQLKRGQSDGLRDPDRPLLEALQVDEHHIAKLAQAFLAQRGERAPELPRVGT